jgi:catechol 2,3-dioxygenase-like lactoylglutathione lyase family enzyme
MKMNHLHLTVPNPLETRKFLEKYFGLQGDVNPYTGESIKGGKESKSFACLFDDDGLVLILTNFGARGEVTYPDDFHIGFIQESEARVNELNRRLKDDGYDVPPPSKQHGSWTFYFRAPGGFTIEVLS